MADEQLKQDSLATDSVESLRSALKDAQLEIAAAVSHVATAQDALVGQQQEVVDLQEQITVLKQTIALQRNKLKSLVMDNEHIGAEREILASLERRLLHISSNPHAALAELLAWRHLGMNRLAPTIDAANKQVDILWNYVREMRSPGHRIISFLGKIMASTWVGRKLRASMHYLFLLLKAE